MNAGKIWKRGAVVVLILCLAAFLFPIMLNLSDHRTETEDVLETSVYKRFYFQGGLHMLPGTCISYTWTYMEEGDSVQIIVNGDGTLKTGICRFSDSKKFGMQQAGNFAMTLIVPSSGYYKVFIVNPSDEMVTFKGVAVCSRS